MGADLSRNIDVAGFSPNVDPSLIAAIIADFPQSIQLNQEALSLRQAGKFAEAEIKYKDSHRRARGDLHAMTSNGT